MRVRPGSSLKRCRRASRNQSVVLAQRAAATPQPNSMQMPALWSFKLQAQPHRGRILCFPCSHGQLVSEMYTCAEGWTWPKCRRTPRMSGCIAPKATEGATAAATWGAEGPPQEPPRPVPNCPGEVQLSTRLHRPAHLRHNTFNAHSKVCTMILCRIQNLGALVGRILWC